MKHARRRHRPDHKLSSSKGKAGSESYSGKKILWPKRPCGFESRPRHHFSKSGSVKSNAYTEPKFFCPLVGHSLPLLARNSHCLRRAEPTDELRDLLDGAKIVEFDVCLRIIEPRRRKNAAARFQN